MDAQIRVSSKISNGPIILNVDCDMYSNNSEIVREALCFFMDEEKGHEIAYVQFPQDYNNLTRNDLYGTGMKAIQAVGNFKNNYTLNTVSTREEYILINYIRSFGMLNETGGVSKHGC